MLCDDLEEGGRAAQEGWDVGILTADSHCYTAEANTTCRAITLQLKIKKGALSCQIDK